MNKISDLYTSASKLSLVDTETLSNDKVAAADYGLPKKGDPVSVERLLKLAQMNPEHSDISEGYVSMANAYNRLTRKIQVDCALRFNATQCSADKNSQYELANQITSLNTGLQAQAEQLALNNYEQNSPIYDVSNLGSLFNQNRTTLDAKGNIVSAPNSGAPNPQQLAANLALNLPVTKYTDFDASVLFKQAQATTPAVPTIIKVPPSSANANAGASFFVIPTQSQS